MTDDPNAEFNRQMDANRSGRPVLAWPKRSNGQGSLPIHEPEPAREKRLRGVMWWEWETWDEAAIPARRWIAKPLLLRRTVTALAGPGSGGKSSLMLAWAVALALGKPYRPLAPEGASRVLIYNVEDDREEQQRRISATLRQFDSFPANLGDRIIRCGPEDIGTLIELDAATGTYVFTPAWEALEYLIERFRPDVIILDPLVELHTAEENDNTALRAVIARFRVLSIQHDCSVVLIHHTRKGAEAGDMEGIRGASALNGAARVVLTAFPMTDLEAETHNVAAEKKRTFFRLDAVKQNYAPQGEPIWHQLIEYELANGEAIAAAIPWTPPSLFRDISAIDCNRVLDVIAAGPEAGVLFAPQRRGKGAASHRWVGRALVEECGLTEDHAARIIKTWLGTGLLVETTYEDPGQRKPRKGVAVVEAKRPTSAAWREQEDSA